MDSGEFLQDHAQWKYGNKKKVIVEEEPRTWLMARSGAYFPLDGNLDCEIRRLLDLDMLCTVHHNQTSTSMSQIQSDMRGHNE